MGKMQRTKGATWERDVVNAARAMGLDARRTAPNQTQDGSTEYGDVTIEGKKCECKHHANIPQWRELVNAALLDHCGFKPGKIMAGWLRGHDALILKQTGGWCPLVVVNVTDCFLVMTLEKYLDNLADWKNTRVKTT